MIALIFSGTSARWVSDVQFDGAWGAIPAGAGEEGCDARRRTPQFNLLAVLVTVLHPAMLRMMLVIADSLHVRSVRVMDAGYVVADFCVCETGSKHHHGSGDSDTKSSLHACSPSVSREPPC